MVNPYTQIINYDKPDLASHLEKIELLHIFKPLLNEFEGKIFNGAVKFIVYAYSLESEVLHSTGLTWNEMAKVIYQKSGLPNDDEIFDKIANLKDATVQEVIDKWIEFQNSEPFADYINARDLRKHCIQTSKTADKIKERMEAVKYAAELLNMMNEAKAKFIENYDAMKPSLTALKKEKKTLGPQDYAT